MYIEVENGDNDLLIVLTVRLDNNKLNGTLVFFKIRFNPYDLINQIVLKCLLQL